MGLAVTNKYGAKLRCQLLQAIKKQRITFQLNKGFMLLLFVLETQLEKKN